MDPRNAADPRDGQLADGRPERTRRGASPRSCRTWPPASPTSPARPSRRSRSPARCRSIWSRRAPRSTCRPSSRSPTGRSPTPSPAGPRRLTVAQILAQSSNVGAVTIGLELGAAALRPLGADVRLRRADRRRSSRARSRASCPTPSRVLGLDDGQPADRPGPLGDADADGGRLLGDRQRRHPARRRSWSSTRTATRVVGAAGPPGDQLARPRRSCGDARGRARAGRHGLRGQRPRLHARRQDRDRADGRERHLLGHPVRRLVRRLRARRRTRSCWSRWSSTSRRASYYGGTVAAPAFGEIAKFALPYLGIPPDQRCGGVGVRLHDVLGAAAACAVLSATAPLESPR